MKTCAGCGEPVTDHGGTEDPICRDPRERMATAMTQPGENTTEPAQYRAPCPPCQLGNHWACFYDAQMIAPDNHCSCCGMLQHERAPKPRVFYTVVWDYVGGDCGDLPAYCDTEEEAERYGQSWVDDTMDELRVTEPDLQPGDEGYPVFWVRRHEIFGGYDHVYDEDGKPLFTRVADIRRARR